MRKMTATRLVLLLACALTFSGCATNEQLVFVDASLTADGDPKQMVRTAVPTEPMSALYFDGEEWILVDDVIIPAGWYIVSPGLILKKD